MPMRYRAGLLGIAALVLLDIAAAYAQSIGPPKAEPTDFSETYYGSRIADPYRWMEDRKNPAFNTWKDFIACAEYLIAERYTSSRHLAGLGRSAGGILIGNTIAERPDLLAAAIVQVGVMNPLRAETTANGPPNIPEYGSFKTEDGFKGLLAMDSYTKIRDRTAYPAVLLTHGINDPRVDPWQSGKMAARLQAATNSGKPVWLRVDYDSGHAIGSSRRQRIEEQADTFAFLFSQLSARQTQDHPRSP